MWLEMIVGGKMVTFSKVGMWMDSFGRDPRCEWAQRIEAEARRICGNTNGVIFTCLKGDLSIRLHEDALRSVIRAINEAEPSMSPEVRSFYQRVCYLLEKSDPLEASQSPG
jgi:hypothetical protein